MTSDSDGAAVLAQVRDAVAARRWDSVAALLHPYLHWTWPDGSTTRGRRKVLDALATAPPPPLPRRWELRDGQVYRWVSG